MKYRSLINTIFEKSKDKMDNMEVYIENNNKVEIKVFKGEIDDYTVSESGGLSFRGNFEDEIGYAYTEKLDESSVDMLIEDAIENGKHIDAEDKEEIFAGSETYEDFNNYNDDLDKISLEEKIQFVKELEEEAYKLDDRVETVAWCSYTEVENERYLVNTKGINLKDKMNVGISSISVIVKEGEDTKTGAYQVISSDYSKFNPKEMAKEAVNEAVSMLGASTIKSGEYPVVFRNDVFANILGMFTPIFSAENVDKGISLLKDKINEKVSTSKVTIVDDPFLEDGIESKYFDSEGTATSYREIVDEGILKTYLYNWKAAKKSGVESTGNAKRDSYKSSISIAPNNLYILDRDNTLDQLIESIEKGLMIINVEGLHSGLDPVSGDYSLSAYGYEIEDGKIKRPVNQITIAGNFFETLMDIEDVGNDLKFEIPFIGGYVGSPSVKVKKISVAGD
ncbi:MAG TPA: TldD/PmbA family protein [Tissierellales bacterium]|nr:TldD/PmbA family protein [Tissierellales bacterium]